MDDDYNVIDEGNCEPLAYPDDDDPTEAIQVNEAGVLAELNGLGRRPGKRKFYELFDDDSSSSHPIDWHMKMPISLQELESKRYKEIVEEEILDRITNKIVEARIRKNGSKLDADGVECNENAENLKQLVLRMPPTDGSDWVGVSSDGNDHRLYIRLFKGRRKILFNQNYDNFPFLNLSKVIAEVEELKKQAVARKNEPSIRVGNFSDLWVDKYKPNTYADLISDDAINRNLLTWLKLWDECVFHRKLDVLNNLVDEKEMEVYCLDSGKPRRPRHKILLLSGPAGLGKTTLAKIVARHAGFDTVEVNASDSRTIADFDKVLEGTVRSSRTISANGRGRPNCLIMDEIDGAPADSINHLVHVVQGAGKRLLRRPIICICNNLFSRSLRELRTIALSVVMTSPKEERIVERLSEISMNEHIRIDRNYLSKLVQLCGGDVRSALNCLQYIGGAKQEHETISLKNIQEAVALDGNVNSSIFDGWSTILELTKHVDTKRILLSEQKRIRAIQKLVTEEADERFTTGLFSNYVRLPLPVSTLHKATLTFIFQDELNSIVNHTQNFNILRYKIAFYALLHLTVATHQRAHLKFPQLEQNMTQRHKESQETLAEIRSQLSSRKIVGDLIKDILPFVIAIVQPPIKPMNEQLYGGKDRKIIYDVVAVMHAYNLTYSPTMINTQVQFIFQPSIDILTLYNLSDLSHRVSMPNSIRQMIARHVELFGVRAEMNIEKGVSKKNKAIELVENARRHTNTQTVLHFHFNHGVSNAVKKNIRLGNIFP